MRVDVGGQIGEAVTILEQQDVRTRIEPEKGGHLVRNTGQAPAQLVSRHWIITDAEGAVQEVEGAGVVGKQPLLRPGEQFEYTSGCTIATPVGTMKGSYRMVAEDGSRFDAPVPEFTLAMPRTLH